MAGHFFCIFKSNIQYYNNLGMIKPEQKMNS